MTYTNGTADPVTYYYVLNLQGDVVKLVEHRFSGRVYNLITVAEYTYNAWGEVLTATGAMAEINPLRYRGYYYDAETGFYYLQSRYYDPTMHRFINADSYQSTGTGVLGYNMFVYCDNNPSIFADYNGEAKVYVLFYDNPESGFYAQSHNATYYNDSSVEYLPFTTAQEFIDAWNSMEGDIDEVYIYAHGGKGTLYFEGGKITADGTYTFNMLNNIKVNDTVYLFSCLGGKGKEGNNVAWALAKKLAQQYVRVLEA